MEAACLDQGVGGEVGRFIPVELAPKVVETDKLYTLIWLQANEVSIAHMRNESANKNIQDIQCFVERKRKSSLSKSLFLDEFNISITAQFLLGVILLELPCLPDLFLPRLIEYRLVWPSVLPTPNEQIPF